MIWMTLFIYLLICSIIISVCPNKKGVAMGVFWPILTIVGAFTDMVFGKLLEI